MIKLHQSHCLPEIISTCFSTKKGQKCFELVTHFPEGEERKSRGGKVSILLGGHRPLGTLITFDERKIKRGNSGHGRHGRLFAKKSPRQNAVGFKMMLLNWLINAIAVGVCRLAAGWWV